MTKKKYPETVTVTKTTGRRWETPTVREEKVPARCTGTQIIAVIDGGECKFSRTTGRMTGIDHTGFRHGTAWELSKGDIERLSKAPDDLTVIYFCDSFRHGKSVIIRVSDARKTGKRYYPVGKQCFPEGKTFLTVGKDMVYEDLGELIDSLRERISYLLDRAESNFKYETGRLASLFESVEKYKVGELTPTNLEY